MKIRIFMSKIFTPNLKTAQLKQIDPILLYYLICSYTLLVQLVMYLPVMLLFII